MRQLPWMLAVVLFFAAAYAGSLVMLHIEEDAAISLEYHVLGRVDSLQPSFALLQSGMDTVLGWLPPREPVVRFWAIVTSAFAAALMSILMLALILEWTGPPGALPRVGMALAFLLAVPELVYLGLMYTPMLIGVCLALGAHLLLRRGVLRLGSLDDGRPLLRPSLLAPGLLLGLGGVFRWDILAYGLVMLLDALLLFRHPGRPGYPSAARRCAGLLVVGAAAFGAWLALELATSDLSRAIPQVLEAISITAGESRLTDFRVIGGLALLFTPGFVLACLAGAWSMLRLRGGPMWFVVLVLVLALLWPFWSAPKEVLVLIPAFGAIFGSGVVCLQRWASRGGMRKLAVPLFWALLAAPWALGVQMTVGESTWGPGFELGPFDRPAAAGARPPRLCFAAGAAFPSYDGARPLWGHGHVLFGGLWREMAAIHQEEIGRAFALAEERSLPFLVGMHYDAFIVNHAAALGYSTQDPELHFLKSGFMVRRLTRPDKAAVVLYRRPFHALVENPAEIARIMRESGKTEAVAWAEPGKMRFLFGFAPEAVAPLGPRTALLDLERLFQAARAGKE